MSRDPAVMRHFPSLLSLDESDAFADRVDTHFDRHGYGPWAVELVGGPPFIGFVGVFHPTFDAPFTPCLEIGWRLAAAHWGKGYAIEAAIRAMDHAFGPLGFREIVAYTVPENVRSRRLMDRLGMSHDSADDFDHPRLPIDDPHSRHVLYRKQRPSRT